MNAAQHALAEALRRLKPKPRLPVSQWAETYRRMSQEESAFVGRFSFRLTPWWRWFLDRWEQPDVRKGVSQKSAQVAWTQGVIANVLGKTMHAAPTSCIVMFPKEGSARNFDREKFTPMVDSTPALAEVLPRQSRVKDNTALFKKFPGGFVKFVGSNSIADVKSTSAKLLVVEEPDDCNLNLRGQGDAIKLLEERGKTFRDVKLLIGGTPSIKGVSSIEDEMLQSDQNRWMVPCPDCGEYQALEWEQVRWLKDADPPDPVFGTDRPETARYCCAHCGSLWTDAQKNLAVQRGRAEPQAPFRGTLGLYINELYVPWHQSRLEVLVQKYLTAKAEEAKGNLEALIVFYNASMGRAWEHTSALPEASELAARGLEYAPNTVPRNGLVLTMGVDVQHNRLAVIVRAWGRGEESWLVLFDELEGNAPDARDRVWDELEALLFGTFVHETGAKLRVRACSIDAGDGTSAEAVYQFVRRCRGRGVELMAIKGSTVAESEIFRRPAPSVDSVKRNTRAAKHGLRTFMVGVSRAKDLLLGDKGPGRLQLEGEGPGRIHWYASVRADYLEQFTAEVKVPIRGANGRRVWQARKGRRNEVLDAEIYALHAARAVKVHLLREAQWQAIEAQVRQVQLEGLAAPQAEPQAPVEEPDTEAAEAAEDLAAEDRSPTDPPAAEPAVSHAKAPRPARRPLPRGGGFVNGWR